MASRVSLVTLDCTDVDAVARFWAAALDRQVEPGVDGVFAYVGAEGDPFRLCIMKTPDTKVAKNRMHLDLQAEDRQLEVKRLVALGAHVVGDHDEDGSQWTTLRDVEGNEFCVF
jgi:hypothetical protein